MLPLTIASIDRICVVIGIGSQGRVGLVVAESSLGVASTYVFDGHVPRERWTHVAFVATKSPNRVSLYVDGMLRGTAKDSAFPLPMAAVGAPSLLSFSGCLLDVRLWSRPKSAAEVQQGMHRLVVLEDGQETAVTIAGSPPRHDRGRGRSSSPSSSSSSALVGSVSVTGTMGRRKPPSPTSSPSPPGSRGTGRGRDKGGGSSSSSKTQPVVDLSCRGLVGWWTFEDGVSAGNSVADVTEHRYRSLVGRVVEPPVYAPPPLLPEGCEVFPQTQTQTQAQPHRQSQSGDPSQYQQHQPDRVDKSLLRAPPASSLPVFEPAFHWLDAEALPLPRDPPLLPGEDRMLPVPSFSSRGVCAVELRRHRLAKKGRALQVTSTIHYPL